MPQPALGPRVLLRQLREVMAGVKKPQERLDEITRIIAANVVAEVCSIYVMRPGRVLELFASKGLNPKAVHKTRIDINEGLVGIVARTGEPVSTSDAQAHVGFKFFPETGEEVYHSFLGVPILRNGKPIGVLVVQNEASRRYSSEEEEAVQTTAMVLAEILASGELAEISDPNEADVAHLRSHFLTGEPVVDGIAMGTAILHEPKVTITNFVAIDIEHERARFEAAIKALRDQIDMLISSGEPGRGADYGDVLETYRMFANDRGWAKRIIAAIETGLTAEAAVDRIQNENRARLEHAANAYLHQRLTDLDDLANRLLRILTGTAQTAAREDLPDNAIVVAREMGAAELLDYDRGKLRGVVLEGSAANSHVAIVARALDIPLVGEIDNITELVDTGENLIVDGMAGELHVRPSEEVRAAYVEKVRFYARKQARFAKLRDKKAITRDGVDISLYVNGGLQVELGHLDDSGADGIGLFRTELQFMISRSFPRRHAQLSFYRSVLEKAGDKPVVFRSLDIGSDKKLPYLKGSKEENPALGWRGLRMSLSRPAFLKLQIKALLQAAAGKVLRLMFPFVAELSEFIEARAMVMRELAILKKEGQAVPRAVKLGVMIEVPAILWQLDNLLPEVDFVSIGSNDLAQYLFAVDRSDAGLARRYDLLSPAFLRVLKNISDKCKALDVPLTLCGEMAGKPLEAMALIGIGFRAVSMAPASIGPVKEMILSLDRGRLTDFMSGLIGSPNATLRPQLRGFARGNKIII